MARDLSTAEKRLIEREFVAREEESLRRRTLFRGVFLIGIISAVGSAALHEFRVRTLVSPALLIVWLVCVTAYVGAAIFPGSLAQDMDARWHMNPWQAALRNLSKGRTQAEAIALLVSPVAARLLFSFVYLGFKA